MPLHANNIHLLGGGGPLKASDSFILYHVLYAEVRQLQDRNACPEGHMNSDVWPH